MAPDTYSPADRLAALAGELLEALPPLDENEQRVALALYRLLAEGEPVPPERIAEQVGLPLERVEALLASWPGVYRDSEGSVIGFWGLSLGGCRTA